MVVMLSRVESFADGRFSITEFTSDNISVSFFNNLHQLLP